jgi:DNA-dependent metalloprotease WSS1
MRMGQSDMQGLNVNGCRGKTREIRIRLRPHHTPNSFLPYEDVLGTMLHEITHNVRGPHDAQFYSILDEVTRECEELMAKGVSGTGVGFDGPSMGRLGGHSWMPTHNPPIESIRTIQLKCVLSLRSC